MKKGNAMKHNVLFAAVLVSGLAFAQAPVQKAAPEAPKPVAVPAVAPAAVTAEAPKPMAPAKKSRRNEDARQCLEKPDNTAIIKCAEEYL
jgi:hypothetical protein